MSKKDRRACSAWIQNAANLATVFAALVAAGAFYYGYRQFSDTQEATLKALNLQKETLTQEKDNLEQEREGQAVELYVKYNELMEESASGARSARGDVKFWRDNRALSIIETIFKLREKDAGWRATVGWMLGNHTDALTKDKLNCGSYDPAFIQFAKEQMKQDVCLKP